MAGKIVPHKKLCLNTRYKKMTCRRCARICSKGCISEKLEFDLSKCDECGLCMAVCPAEAIAGENYSRKDVENMLNMADSPLVLCCSRQDKQSCWPCLGFLDTRLFLAMAYSGKGKRKVVVDNRRCSKCNPKVADYLQRLLYNVNIFLHASGKSPIVQGQAVSNYPHKEKVVSRRAFFGSLIGDVMTVITEVVRSDGNPAELLPRQEFFSTYVKYHSFPEMMPTSLFNAISIGKSCHACGLCAKICPQKAIEIKEQGEVVDFYHRALTCTGCEVCVAHCPQKAITLVPAHSLKITYVATHHMPRCPQCNKVYQPVGNNSLCFECLTNDR
ncbi:NAD(P)H-quinone oxidoreductase subunit I, chloroplastic [Sporomusa rhizae]|uniref:4Fe-4S binding protein n=1 Tax=Sporomusa rhizae TaxID=357999 RepID=UPI00352B7EC2